MKLSFERVSQMIAKSLAISVDELSDSLQVAGTKDLDDVLAFRRAYFKDFDGWDDRAYLKWRFDFTDHPVDSSNAMWILRINGEILGIIGLESFTLMVHGKATRACHPSELLSRPDLNGLGIGAWLSLAVARKCAILMVVGSTAESLKLIKRLFQPMANYQSWKLVISAQGTLFRLTRSRALAIIGALFLDRLMHLRRYISLDRKLDASFSARPIMRFSNEMDQWPVHFNRAQIFRRRDSAYLNWRFLDNPRQRYSAIGLYRDQQLVGYAIYFIVYSEKNRQKEAVIADLFWDAQAVTGGDLNEFIKNLLVVTVRELVTQGARLIELKMIMRGIESVLAQSGFSPRGDCDIFALMTSDADANQDLYKSDYWMLTAADAHDDGL